MMSQLTWSPNWLNPRAPLFRLMMSQLTWSALILTVLAAVAYSNPEGQPACSESRPVFGVRACCERHKLADLGAFWPVSDLESGRRPKGLLDRRTALCTCPCRRTYTAAPLA